MSMDKKKTTENKKRSQKDFNCDYIRGLLRVVVTNDSSNELTLATAEANRLYVGIPATIFVKRDKIPCDNLQKT